MNQEQGCSSGYYPAFIQIRNFARNKPVNEVLLASARESAARFFFNILLVIVAPPLKEVIEIYAWAQSSVVTSRVQKCNYLGQFDGLSQFPHQRYHIFRADFSFGSTARA